MDVTFSVAHLLVIQSDSGDSRISKRERGGGGGRLCDMFTLTDFGPGFTFKKVKFWARKDGHAPTLNPPI